MSIFSKISNFFIGSAGAATLDQVIHLPVTPPFDGNSEYRGIRIEHYDKGKLIAFSDNRILIEEQKLKVKETKKEAEERILRDAPYYKQFNAALGLLTPEETDRIRLKIQQHRDWSTQKEIDVNNAMSLDVLESIRIKQ